jgi:manganese oxidase
VSPLLRFWGQSSRDGHAGHGSHDPTTGMAGLVLGIRVTGESSARQSVAPPPARRVTLVMHRREKHWNPEDAYGFAIADGTRETSADDVKVPGPLLVLTRGEPVEITLRNELPEATAIHWHGIELDSYYDGVPGWSGTAVSTTPAIDPRSSFVVRFTPTRAGTFIYHTHSHDNRQLASGLYGPIVVLEPGETFDSTRDHIVLLGMEGTKSLLTGTADRFPVVINGSRQTELRLKAGVPNRLRLINITASNAFLNVSLIAANEPVLWRPVAKDGTALPPGSQVARPAWRQPVSVGETFDFLVDPVANAALSQTFLEIRSGAGAWVQQARVLVTR